MKQIYLLFASLLVVGAFLLAGLWQSRLPKLVALIPTLTGKVEYCLTCHSDLPEISASHPVKTFGCVVCHGGEPLALDADLAHSTLRGGSNPSDLQVVEISCGGSNCHSGLAADHNDHIQRVLTSLQATYAGAIASVRYTFGAQSDLQAYLSAVELPPVDGKDLMAFDPASEKSPALAAFVENCLSCHLSAQPMPGMQYARFTGCAACHTPTAGSDLSAANQPLVHKLTTSIPYTQCDTCHNRGNYDLVTMQFHPRTDHPSDRMNDYYQPIAQFTSCEWKLDCVDCHTSGEAMGDGVYHNNKKEARYITCSTCHGTLGTPPLTHTITDPNDLALRLAFLNPVIDLKVGDTILVTEKGEPLWNTRQLPDGSFELFGKVTAQRFIIPAVKGSACQQKVDEQESKYCHVCHSENY
jgi:hypothetical protein